MIRRSSVRCTQRISCCSSWGFVTKLSRARRPGSHHVDGSRERRDEDDGQALQRRIAAKGTTERVTVTLRHHDVADDEIRLPRLRLLERIVSVDGDHHLVAVILEEALS